MLTHLRNLLFPTRSTDPANPDPGSYFTLQYEAERYRVVKILGVGKAEDKIDGVYVRVFIHWFRERPRSLQEKHLMALALPESEIPEKHFTDLLREHIDDGCMPLPFSTFKAQAPAFVGYKSVTKDERRRFEGWKASGGRWSVF